MLKNRSTFLNGSNSINTLFLFIVSLIITLLTHGKSMYVISLIISSIVLFINAKEIKSLRFKPNYQWIIFSFSIFIFFFYHFIGFDFVGNEIHKDLIYYGALSDFLGTFKHETTEINLFHGIVNDSPWNIYHYLEIWISGFIGNTFHVPAIKILLLFTYPLFCLISFHNLQSFLSSENLEFNIGKTILSIGIFFTILSWLPNVFNFIPSVKSFIAFNEYLSSGYIKLLIAIPLVLNTLNYFRINEKSMTDHLIYFLVLFFYPTLIPFGLGLFIFMNIKLLISKFIKPNHFLIIIGLLLIGIGIFQRDILQPIKMDLVRLGVPSIIILYIFYKNKNIRILLSLFFSILVFALFMQTSFVLSRIYLPNVAMFHHVDLFQTWSNFTTILSFMMFFVLIHHLINQLKFEFDSKPIFSIVILIIPFLISSGKPIKSYVRVTNIPMANLKNKYFVIEDKLSDQNINLWNLDLVYMLITEKHSQYVWENCNFFLINNMQITKNDTQQNLTYYKNEIRVNQKYLNNINFLDSHHLDHKITVSLNLK